MSKKWKIGIIVIVLLAVVAVCDWKIGGNANFYRKWVECGHRPLTANPGWLMAGDVPHYGKAPLFDPLRAGRGLFCSPLEAERAGYSASIREWQFPNLKKAGEYLHDDREDSGS